MVDLNQLKDIGIILGVVATLTGLFYSYYKSPKVRNAFRTVLPFLPALFEAAAGRDKDTKGVFDTHDMWAVLGRVSKRLRTTLDNPANANFEDVQDDVIRIITEELNVYRNAGVKNVPDISDEAVKVQVRVVFEAIKRAAGEDSTGNNS